eukprot:1186577-Prorocentrum_minimum.AAC.1
MSSPPRKVSPFVDFTSNTAARHAHTPGKTAGGRREGGTAGRLEGSVEGLVGCRGTNVKNASCG